MFEICIDTLYDKGQSVFIKMLIKMLCQVYKGYVDDPRNTDNAWMETVAVNFHDESGIKNLITAELFLLDNIWFYC